MDFPALFQDSVNLHSEWGSFVKAHNEPPVVSIRINPAKSNVRTGPRVPWTETGFYLSERPSFTLDPLFHAGTYYVQDASSMSIEPAIRQHLDLKSPLRVLDLCGAPGGKSTHILSLINRESLLVSNEVISPRATLLSENIQKWGYPNVLVSNNDPQSFADCEGYFDAIIADLPCSGEGLFRKDPSAMQEWSPAAVEHCALRQRRILADVWPALKGGGILIYSTCTYNEKENEANLAWLGSQYDVEFPGLAVDNTWGIVESRAQGVVGYRMYPHKVRGEGFFVSVVRKKGDAHKPTLRPRLHFNAVEKKIADEVSRHLVQSFDASVVRQQDHIILVPSHLKTDMEWLSERLKAIVRGTAVATQKHDKLIPEHAWALSIIRNQDHSPSMELSLDQSLSYLRRDALDVGSTDKGFAAVTYQGVPLGWINRLGSRFNNLYPQGWRIRNV